MSPRSETRTRAKAIWRLTLLFVCFVSISLLLVIFYAGKSVLLPAVDEGNTLPVLKTVDRETRIWSVVHALAKDCTCSARTAKYLMERATGHAIEKLSGLSVRLVTWPQQRETEVLIRKA